MPEAKHSRDAAAGKPGAGLFATTQWGVVLQAGQEHSPQTAEALESLCGAYWYPLYAYVRRQGHAAHDAQDLTQEFFARLLDRKYLSLADESRGRFRSFLLTSMQHFLVNEWEKARAAKRGGFQQVISLDEQAAEERYRAEPADNLAPDKIFEKRWATTLLEQVLARLRVEYEETGKREMFEALRDFVWGGKNLSSYQEIAVPLRMTEGAVKVAVHRLRQRYREMLRWEVGQTVARPEEIDEELRYLISMLSS